MEELKSKFCEHEKGIIYENCHLCGKNISEIKRCPWDYPLTVAVSVKKEEYFCDGLKIFDHKNCKFRKNGYCFDIELK